ncbi:MAG: capsular biosynthesis protein [Bacteroidetes bacterium]|nr:MAG: capsular biosynthesis protein [Bacteroidota bacterium]
MLQNNVKPHYSQPERKLFREIIDRYLPYWPLFLLLVTLCIVGAAVYLRYAIPVYESTATLLIKDEKKGLDDSKVLESLNLFGSKKIVENEIEIIRSRTLAKEVVRNLHLYAPVKEEGRFVDRSAYVKSPIIIEAPVPDSMKEANKVYFSYDPVKKLVQINGKVYLVNRWVVTDYGRLKFKPNPLYEAPKEPRQLYFSLLNVKFVANGLLNNLKVSPASKLATVIDLSIRDEIPRRAEDILNELMDSYNRAAINDKNELAKNTLNFVDERLSKVMQELDTAESRIQNYKTEQGIVDMSEQGKQFLENVGLNDQKVSEMNVQLAVLDQVEKYVNSKDNKAGIVPSTLGVNDPSLSTMLDKLYESEIEYERLRKTTAENNPILVSLNNEIEKIKPNIRELIGNQRKNLLAGLNNLNTTSNKYSSVLRTMPQKERELLVISRQQSIKNNIYTFLLQKKEETMLSYSSTVSDSRLIDHGESTLLPVSPKTKLIYLGAILLAIAMGIGIVALRQGLNHTIDLRSDIEAVTTVPIIGELVADNTKSEIVVADGRRNYVAEQFRQLRTSLGYLGINNRKKKIAVTSSVAGEGKSFVSANLAISLALTGKKVVVLELDLRKPKISSVFEVTHEFGMTNYLIGDKEPDEIIRRTAVNPNLFIIPSGPIPPNPSELILNGKIQEMLDYLDRIFDVIILDTSPVSPVTDAYILSEFCDATLYVVRHGVTPRNYIEQLDENNKVRVLKNLAIVFNGVPIRGLGKNGYGYGYVHAYGHGGRKNGKSNGKSTITDKAVRIYHKVFSGGKD